MSTPTPPELPDRGGDSVVEMHRQLMAEMNDAALTADGTPPDEERDTLQGMLDVIAREHAEPRDGFEPVPFWVALIFGGLLAWGGYYLGTNSADFRADVFDGSDLRSAAGAAANVPDPDPQTLDELMKIGKQKFESVCAACHLPTGVGKPAENIPPLDGSEWVAGEQASAGRLSRIVLYGLSGPIQVQGRQFNGVMPNQGNLMKDYEIASVLTYIRNNWNNKAGLISTAVVRKVCAEEAGRKTNGTQPVSQAELLKIPVDLPPPKKD